MERIELMPSADYHGRQNTISQSQLKKMLKSPAHFKFNEVKQTPALRFGSILHEALLEPHTFRDRFCLPFEGDRRTKDGKAAYAAFSSELASSGKTVLKDDEFEMLLGMIDSVKNHPIASRMMESQEKEVSFFTSFEEFPEIQIKARPDIIDSPAIIDLKSSRDASAYSFGKDLVNLGYDFQAAWYLDTVNRYYEESGSAERVKDFIFLVIEKTAPFAIATYICDDEIIQRGRSQYLQCLRDLQMQLERIKDDPDSRWQSYPEKILPVCLPSWA